MDEDENFCEAAALVKRTTRDVPPADFTLRIDDFPLLLTEMEDRRRDHHLSKCFKAGGYGWRLSIYPLGDKKTRRDAEYMSLYLVLDEQISAPVDVVIKFFAYDHIRERYLMVEDANVQVHRFDKAKDAQGISEFISVAAFSDASNGYLLDEICCVFGVELYFIKNRMSKTVDKVYYSQAFEAGERKWKLIIYPRWENKWLALGLALEQTDSLSISRRGFLNFRGPKRNGDHKLYAKYTLVVKDQLNHRDISKEVTRSNRDVPPSDYLLKIESFSLVSKAMDNYLSNYFEAGGYKWRLSIYPNGDKKADQGRSTRSDDRCISVYLMFAEPDILENGLAIDVNFKFFVYDYIQKNFLVFEYAYEQTKKFHKLKCAHGILNLMSTAEFCDASAGRYLVNDSCTFGVELFVKKNMATKAVCLSNVRMPKNDFCMMRAHIWKFDNFSKRKNKLYYSNSFMAGKRKWRLLICPRGDNQCLAAGVELADTYGMFGLNKWLKKANYNPKVYAMFALIIHDQTDVSDLSTNFRNDCEYQF
uniref:MATH domain-containing protein n=1 Tax=Daucus carota subsp. sativus TaxID=79200 RepID=A0A161XUZ5_DAUCS